MEEVIIKKKLLNDERLLRRTIKRLLLLEHEAEEASRTQTAANILASDMAAMELVLRKQERTIAISDQEVSYYERKHHQLETEIAAIGGEIASLEETLVQERRLRENKDAYDAIARDILKYPPRADLQRSIDEVERELAQIASEQGIIQQYIDSRAGSAFDVIQSLKQLKRQVELDLKSL